jgi:zinc transporter
MIIKNLDGLGGILQKVDEETDVSSWIHINYTSKKTRDWLKQQAHISKQAKSFLLAPDTRPRLIIEDDSLIMCLRGINLNKGDAPEDMISIRIWMNEMTILTSCNRDSQSVTNIQSKLKIGQGPKTPAKLLLSLIDELAILTDDFIDIQEILLDKEEDEIANSSFEIFNPKMSQFRRQTATIRRYLSPQKESLEKLFRSKSAYFDDVFFDQLYVQIDKFTHLLETLDLMRERVLVLQEQFMAYISHQQNSRLYLLAIISAIFLPLTFLSGLLGMNVGGLPGIDSSYAFWGVTGFCLVVTVTLLLWFKRSRWF